MTDAIENGARYEFTSGQYPEDTFAFQAITLTDGKAVLSLALTEGTNVFAETVLTLPQLAEFIRSLDAALHQVVELNEANRYGWLRDLIKSGIVENRDKDAS